MQFNLTRIKKKASIRPKYIWIEQKKNNISDDNDIF